MIGLFYCLSQISLPHVLNDGVIHFSGSIHAPDEVKMCIVGNVLVEEQHILQLWEEVGHVTRVGNPIIATTEHSSGDSHVCQVEARRSWLQCI